MSSVPHTTAATSGEVFDSLIALAKARVIVLMKMDELVRADGVFVLRALFDLEADGVELFGDSRPPDAAFFGDVAGYLQVRAGASAVDALALVPTSADVLATRAEHEGRRAASLLGLPDATAGQSIARAALQLIHHSEVNT